MLQEIRPFYCIPTRKERGSRSIGLETPVNKGLAQFLREKKPGGILHVGLILFEARFWRSLIGDRPFKALRGLRIVLRFYRKAVSISEWIAAEYGYALVTPAIVLYSYWLDEAALALAVLRERGYIFTSIARAHGYDLYHDRWYRGHIPFRRYTIDRTDAVFCVSDAGRHYLSDRYPERSNEFRLAPLGTTDPGFTCEPSRDGITRIVSCSSLIALKRVDLIVRSLERLGDRRVNWTHIGEGPEMQMTSRLAAQLLGSLKNVEYTFVGKLENEEVMRFYRDNPVDLYITTSSSEGGRQIACVEALSVGLPIVATAVGGIPEVVGQDNGILLSSDPDPQEVAAAISWLVDRPEERRRIGIRSREKWLETSNAEINSRRFIEDIRKIVRLKLRGS
jgi:colanic acid/amylovoran biosynthesis glycosyltransferase